MSFWGERYRRPDEEDIWEELKQMLLNSPSEQEIALKKQEEQAKIDAVVEKMFPDIKKTQGEPYLRYEDLLNPQGLQKRMQEQYMQEDYQRLMQNSRGDLTPQDILQKMDMFSPKRMNGTNSLVDNYEQEELVNGLTPLQKGYISTERQLSPYEEIDSRQNWSEEMKAQKKAEVAKIQETARAREKEINREYAIKQAKNYGGAALEVGSAFVPGLGGAKLAGAIAKKLAPKFGRKIAQEVSTGMLKGTSSGAIEGLGRGLLEDENILKTAGHDAVTGAVLGTGLGTAGANVQKVVKGKKLKQYGDIDLLDKNSRKKYNKDAREYYQDYNQGTVVNKDGPIEFTNRGQREVLRWNPKQAQNFPDLSKDIKTADKLPNMPNRDSGKIYTDHFEIYRGKLGDHLIDVNKNGNRRYYTTKDIPEGSLRTPSTGTFENANNIIPQVQQNLNPSSQTIRNKLSHNAWLEKLKCKRRRRGMF